MFSDPGATIYVPDGMACEQAASRITHLGIGAHADDLEFMAFHGILECYGSEEKWFGGVTCTDGKGSSRSGAFAGLGNDEMGAVRLREQNLAADLGRYGIMFQLNHPSKSIQDSKQALIADLAEVLRRTTPEIVYTHNPADKHDTHVAVFAAALAAIRSLPPAQRPARVWGCEVWRDLDWLPDESKALLDVGGHDELAAQLNGAFVSQIGGGKRYDLAVMGRRRANATFFDSHLVDGSQGLTFALDLTPLTTDEAKDPTDYVLEFIDRFRADVEGRLKRHLA